MLNPPSFGNDYYKTSYQSRDDEEDGDGRVVVNDDYRIL